MHAAPENPSIKITLKKVREGLRYVSKPVITAEMEAAIKPFLYEDNPFLPKDAKLEAEYVKGLEDGMYAKFNLRGGSITPNEEHYVSDFKDQWAVQDAWQAAWDSLIEVLNRDFKKKTAADIAHENHSAIKDVLDLR